MLALKTVVPGQFAVTPQVQQEDMAPLAEQGFKTVISNRPDNEKPDQPSSGDIRSAAEMHGLRYVHIPVALSSISREDLDAFHEVLKNGPLPAVAHCGTGKRSYLLWAAGEVLYRGRSTDELVHQGGAIGLDVKELPEVVKQLS